MAMRRRPRTIIGLIILVAVLGAVGAVAFGAYRYVNDRPQQRSAAKLCDELAKAQTLDQAIVTLDPTTLGPQVSALQQAAEVAPSDIEGPLTALASFVGELADEVRATNTAKKEALTNALAARQDRIDEITADGQAVEAWSIANCGLPLRASSTTTIRK
jgi:Tfp pilus assembly protein PilE